MRFETTSHDDHPIARIIRDRRTVRLFTEEPVSTELLTELLNIAIWAPTHGNRQPWRFVLYRDEGRMPFAEAVVRSFATEQQKRHIPAKLDYYGNIPAHLIVVMKEDPRSKQWEEDFAAVSCLIQNFQLAAWERGLGVVWKTNTYINEPDFRSFAGIGPGEKIVGVLHIGYPKLVPPVRGRISAEELLTVIDADAGETLETVKR